MKVTVCIGSSCHIKGARFVVEKLQTCIVEIVAVVTGIFGKNGKNP